MHFISRLMRFALFSIALIGGSAFAQNAYVNFEGKQTSPIRLSADGTKLFAVNTPDARLSVFDVTHPDSPFLLHEIPVGIEPVSVAPRTSDEVWVVNEVSDSISIVSLSARMVIDTLPCKDEPADVAFVGGKAYVTCSRNNLVRIFDVTNHAQVGTIALFGENPRSIVANASGTKLYVAFALSGNHTTLVPATNAPPQPAPTNTNLPAPPQVSLIIDATNSSWTNIIKYTMPDNDVAEIDVATATVSRYFSHVGTENFTVTLAPDGNNLFVANTDARNLTRFEPNVRGHIINNRVARIAIADGTLTNFDLNAGIDYSVLPNFAAKSNALSQPMEMAFDPSGAFFYIASFGTDRIAKVDINGNVLARVDIGNAVGASVDPANKRGPRGLALNAAAQRLYVLNRLANSLSVVDVNANAVLKEIPVGSFDPTPPVVRNGRGFLYDAKLSGNGTAACASCHIDAEMDLLAWDLGDPNGQMVTNKNVFVGFTNNSAVHPMKGPMTTQTLRGLKGLEPFHWRGDRTNLMHFNGAFDTLMGGSPVSPTDIAAYKAFVDTITLEPNPNQNLDRTYPTNFAGGDASAGRNTFFNEQYQPSLGLSCNSCHSGPPGPGSNKTITPAAALQESQDFKVPQLRNVYQKMNFNSAAGASSIGGFGITHDGTDPTLFRFLSRPVFGNFASDATRKNNLSAFVQCFDTGMAPCVGYTRTVNAATLPAATDDWNLLESQAALTNIDLVVKGTINGKFHGLLYTPATATYRGDTTNIAAMTRSTLTSLVQGGDSFTVMGVPPGSGLRMAIDRNGDGVLDGDALPPALNASLAGSNSVIKWPFIPGFGLESSPTLQPGSWSAVTDAIEVQSNQNVLTKPQSSSAVFYRLRSF